LDLEIFRLVHVRWHHPILDIVNLILSWSGLGVIVGLVAIAAFFYKPTKQYGVPVLLSVLLGGLVFAHSVKILMPRPRPSNLSFANAQEPHRQSSFPSAHTATAFAAATAVALRVRRKRFATSAFVWAVGVGVSRIYRGVHWPSDVLAGACLGILAGCLVHLLLSTTGDQRRSKT
jgi:undecaprenyl-diphosphatase